MSIPNNYFGKSFEAKASTSFLIKNNDYVIWAAKKQLTRVSCQHLQNVSLSICWENAGKMSGRRRPAPAQRGIMEFFDIEKRQVSNYNVCYLIHLIVALVAVCILGSL